MKTKISYILAIATLVGILNYDFSNEIGNYKFWLFIGAIIVFIVSILFLILQKEKEKILLGIVTIMLYRILTYELSNEVGSTEFLIFIGEIVLFITSILLLIFQKKENKEKQS